MIGYKEKWLDEAGKNCMYTSRRIKQFVEVEDAGSHISYRCVNCRVCKKCKDHDVIEAVSIKEEVEQDIIQKSVTVDINKRETIATLPFMHDPKVKLVPNKSKAFQIYLDLKL